MEQIFLEGFDSRYKPGEFESVIKFKPQVARAESITDRSRFSRYKRIERFLFFKST